MHFTHTLFFFFVRVNIFTHLTDFFYFLELIFKYFKNKIRCENVFLLVAN